VWSAFFFVPCSVCYVVPLSHRIKVPQSTNLHSILCAVCARYFCSMLYAQCVLFLFHATCAMRYITVLHGMSTTCYFSSMLGLPCIIFYPMLCVLSCNINTCSVMLCVTSILCCMCYVTFIPPLVFVCALLHVIFIPYYAHCIFLLLLVT